jgi:phage-related protein (TIGR01555 family)
MNVRSIFDAIPAFDSLRNLISQIGVPAKSKSHAWIFEPNCLTQYDVEAAYGSDWLPRKIVDIIPKHCTREWRTWQADQAEELYATEKTLQVRLKVRKAMIYDRLYGGGALLMGAQTNDPEKPLDVATIKKGELRYLHALHRYQLTEGDLILDIEDPDFGKPAWYTFNVPEDSKLRDVRIHRSRFVFFISLEPPSNSLMGLSTAGRGWGQSLLEFIFRAIIRSEAANENSAALMEEAKLDVVSVPNLPSQLGTREGQSRLLTRFALANQLKSSNSMLLLGGEEKFDRKQISFAGLPELMNAHLQIAAGAAGIPLTVLIGQSPAGLNATGESDTRLFYDAVKEFQTTDLQEALGPLDEALVRSTLGSMPEEVVYEWDPLWQLSDSEKATNGKTKIEAISTLNATGLFAPEELRPAVADMLIDDGFLPTLDQHMLDEAEMAQRIEEQAQAEQEALQQALAAGGGGPPEAGGGGPPDTAGGAQKGNLKAIQGGRTDSADENSAGEVPADSPAEAASPDVPIDSPAEAASPDVPIDSPAEAVNPEAGDNKDEADAPER